MSKRQMQDAEAPAQEARAPSDGDIRSASAGALYFTSFVCGTCVMVVEMAGSRIIAPYMGTSQIVWTSLIGVIMASLTLGYWCGGKIADRRPDARLLSALIAAAAVWSALMALVSAPLLSALVTGLRSVYIASAIASVCLFAVPSVLLGMVSPFIVKLALHGLGTAGATVGRFSALSSAGSILGTFLGGFVLISIMSSRTIMFTAAACLAVVAFAVWPGGKRAFLALAAAGAALGVLHETGAITLRSDGVDIETAYNTIHIRDTKVWHTNREVRILQTDPLGAQSLMYLDSPEELYSDYTKFYDLAFHYRPETKRVLMLGGGGYCVPRHITATRPEVEVDIVELDPGITEAARNWFHLEDRPGQRIFHEDARMYVNRESAEGTRYDAVFEDVFGSAYSIPFHMTTTECMGAIYDMVEDGGVFVVNVIGELGGGLFGGIWSSIADHFQTVMIFPATYPNSAAARQNLMIVALKRADVPEREPQDENIARLLAHRWTAPYEPSAPAFRDEFAPVEKHALDFR